MSGRARRHSFLSSLALAAVIALSGLGALAPAAALAADDTTGPTVLFGCSGTPGPGFSLHACAPDNWFRSSVVVTMDASDEESGVTSFTYTVDGGAVLDYSATGPFEISGDGHHEISYVAVDGAANQEAGTFWVDIDVTAPAASVSINGGASVTNAIGVTLDLSAEDGGSGVASTEAANGGGDPGALTWIPVEAEMADWDLADPLTNGGKTVSYRVTDLAGNTAVVADDITFWGGVLEGTQTPFPVFTSPATTTYASADDDELTYTWLEITDPGATIVSREAVYQRADASAGICGEWVDHGSPFAPEEGATINLLVTEPVHCYRLVLTLTDSNDNSTTTTSSPFIVAAVPRDVTIFAVNPTLTVTADVSEVEGDECGPLYGLDGIGGSGEGGEGGGEGGSGAPEADDSRLTVTPANGTLTVVWSADQALCVAPSFTNSTFGTRTNSALVSYVPAFSETRSVSTIASTQATAYSFAELSPSAEDVLSEIDTSVQPYLSADEWTALNGVIFRPVTQSQGGVSVTFYITTPVQFFEPSQLALDGSPRPGEMAQEEGLVTFSGQIRLVLLGSGTKR